VQCLIQKVEIFYGVSKITLINSCGMVYGFVPYPQEFLEYPFSVLGQMARLLKFFHAVRKHRERVPEQSISKYLQLGFDMVSQKQGRYDSLPFPVISERMLRSYVFLKDVYVFA